MFIHSRPISFSEIIHNGKNIRNNRSGDTSPHARVGRTHSPLWDTPSRTSGIRTLERAGHTKSSVRHLRKKSSKFRTLRRNSSLLPSTSANNPAKRILSLCTAPSDRRALQSNTTTLKAAAKSRNCSWDRVRRMRVRHFLPSKENL